LSANPEAVSYANRGRGIPVGTNLTLGFFYIAISCYQFIYLPLRLLPVSMNWAWTLIPLVFLTNPFWSLIHEAIHDLFHPSRRVNVFFGRFLAILFGAPFRILRMSHLLHHKLNRLPLEGTEFYDRTKSSKARATPAYYFQISLGLYLLELISAVVFFLPRCLLVLLEKRLLRADSISGLLLRNWLGAESLREIRFDGWLTLLWLTLSFVCYGEQWPVLAALLVGRGFLISFLDNIYHYATPVGDIFYAKNLKLPQYLAKPMLNFNLHGVHHVNPAIPWSDLPAAFDAGADRYQDGFFAAAWRQLHGPIALQDLPQGTPALRLRPF
jgi:fatty acid desaturase